MSSALLVLSPLASLLPPPICLDYGGDNFLVLRAKSAPDGEIFPWNCQLYIGIVFFRLRAQPIQCYFALPFCLLCGALFLCESWHNRYDTPSKPNFLQEIFLFYPLFSLLPGRRFPQMATRIMPCPLASLRTTVCAAYPRKNKFLLILLTIWG